MYQCHHHVYVQINRACYTCFSALESVLYFNARRVDLFIGLYLIGFSAPHSSTTHVFYAWLLLFVISSLPSNPISSRQTGTRTDGDRDIQRQRQTGGVYDVRDL